MFKSLSAFLMAALLAVLADDANAAVGIPPNPSNGPSMVDGTWLNGVAGGSNNTYVYGLTAAGTTQATAAQLPSNYALMEADTVASGAGFALPFCYQGTDFSFYNNGANTVTIYPNAVNNPITAAQDTINNTTSVTVASHAPEFFFCAKSGVWAAK